MKATRLSLMMVVQYMMLPVWLLPLLPYLGTLGLGSRWLFAFGLITGIGTFASPFVCMAADRYMNSERVLAVCNAVAALTLGAAYFTVSPVALFLLLLLGSVAYMPTWSLTSAIVMAHASAEAFPRYRMLGSVGWVASGAFSVVAVKFLGVEDFDLSRRIFAAGALIAAVGTLLALVLPPTPPKAKGLPLSVSDAFGLKSFTLFRDRRFLSLGLFLFLGMIPFQWYLVYNPVYLAESGFKYITMTQNIGQIAEMALLLLVPRSVRRFGYRASFAAGFAFLAIRYVFFLLSAVCGFAAGDFGGILMHGLIFGWVVVVAQMYVGEQAPAELRNQAQGLVMLLACGLGLFASNLVMHPVIALSARSGGHDWALPFGLSLAISAVLAVASAFLFCPDENNAMKDLL